MKFPLYRYDGFSIISVNKNQQKAIKSLIGKIESGSYKFRDNPCQCGNPTKEDDLLLVEKDMFGIPNDNIVCSSCGMIRSKQILEDEFLGEYYDVDYKPINYDLSQSTAETYYNAQMYRGKQFFDLAKKYSSPRKDAFVYDMGCGAGGVMHYFKEYGLQCSGNDYSEEFLKYGRTKGMALSYGEMDDSAIEDNSLDYFILSHVYEHLTDTKSYLSRIFAKLKIGGVLIMEVPGLFADISSKTGYPAASCQFAHVINFYHEAFLRNMFEFYNARVLFGNERCTFLVEKTEETVFEKSFVFDAQKSIFPDVLDHIEKTTNEYRSTLNPIFQKRKLARLLKGKVK